jgi:hypothetical protein
MINLNLNLNLNLNMNKSITSKVFICIEVLPLLTAKKVAKNGNGHFYSLCCYAGGIVKCFLIWCLVKGSDAGEDLSFE